MLIFLTIKNKYTINTRLRYSEKEKMIRNFQKAEKSEDRAFYSKLFIEVYTFAINLPIKIF